jgi:arylsulfatase A-like enzyme
VRKADTFVIAAWAATIFGLMEGMTLCISRAYPAILAAHKVSVHILWIAPLVDLFLFLLAAAGLYVLRNFIRRWLGTSSVLLAYGFFVFLGVLTVITAPVILHPLSAVVLSLGLTVMCCRKLRGSESQLVGYLRARLVWIPVLLVMTGLGVSGYDRIREMWLFQHLPPASAKDVNVLVIVMDTVRSDSFARLAEPSLTPHLDRLVANGVRFDNAWTTSSWSLASQASILTGRHPHEHGADWPHFRLSEQYPTLAEFFARRGYVTGAFSGNAAWVTPEYLGRGFLRFDVYLLEDLLRRTVYGRQISRPLATVGYHDAGRGKKASTLNAQFLKFIHDYRGRPFFAYLCYMDVNQSFHNRWLNYGFRKQAPMREVVKAYEQGLTALDTQIGDLFDKLRQQGILENTLVIITSDHGQSFGAAETSDHDPLCHGTSLYPEQIKVPLFVIFPGKLLIGRKVTRLVSTRAIPATITHALGLADSPFIGEPLPNIWGQESPLEDGDACVLATLNYDDHTIQSVLWDRWQYINHLNNPYKSEELYDLARDPLARENLATFHLLLGRIRELLPQLLAVGAPTPSRVSKNPACTPNVAGEDPRHSKIVQEHL